MLQYLLVEPNDLLPSSDDALLLPVRPLGAHTISGDWSADADAPIFALLRAQLGLPIEDGRWWPATGRHLASVPDHLTSPTTVSTPSITLLERTLVALRAWQPSVLAEASSLSRR